MEYHTKLKICIGVIAVVVTVVLVLLLRSCPPNAGAVDAEETQRSDVTIASPEATTELAPTRVTPTATATKALSPASPSAIHTKTASPADLSEAVTFFRIYATKLWQESAIVITPEMRVSVSYENGQWTIFGSGVGEHCGPEGYASYGGLARAYPQFPIGALLGKVDGSKVFMVGNYCDIEGSQMTGMLSLRINDSDSHMYDNGGWLTVKITVSR